VTKFFPMIIRSIFLVFLLTLSQLAQADEPLPRYFAANPGALAAVKARLAAHEPSLQPVLKALISSADKAMKVEPPSVMQKDKLPPSGDKHDYMSIAPYYWPDPSKPNGLPYIRHDGKVNPESHDEAFDHARVMAMADDVQTLSLAYYFTGNEAYAAKAAQFLRVWFLDPATRMNPNLNFTQAVPGENTGRGTGILEGRNIAVAADAAQLLAGSPAWTLQDRSDFKTWLEAYFNWLTTSKNGHAESNSRNNHGSWYDVHVVELALVLGKDDVARQICETAKTKRLGVQIEPDGRQPLELARTAAFGYSQFNLEALFTLATMSEYVGVDLWHCPLSNGQPALATALNFLLPYIADPPKAWPYPQIKRFSRTEFAPELRQAAIAYQEPKYEKILSQFSDAAKQRFQLLFPLPDPPGLEVAAIDRERILRAASAALTLLPITITAYHAKLSEGGPHDYYSNGDYWWPDPTKTNGLPYIQRDGQTNPENFNEDRMALRHLRDAVAALGAAYKITGENRYAAKAAELLRVFFLDPATRMNPNLKYAQAVPGVSPGRGIGIIDTLHLIEVPVAIEAMQKSPAFPAETLAGLKQWFRDYTEWMLSSKNGHDEATAKNNHAVAFWLQVAVFAQFTGNEAQLAECRQEYKDVFVPDQMAANGSFPRELARTKPYGYSIFQLDNLATLCQVLSTAKDDLWNFQLPDGRGIRKAVAYLYPYLADKSKWPLKPDVMAWDDWPARQSSLLFAGLAFDEPQYLALWKKLSPDPADEEVQRNIAITQPVLWLNQPCSVSSLVSTK
jgi:Alginate lyase